MMSAYEKAKLLLASGDPAALEKFLEYWKAGKSIGSARYVIDVVQAYNEITAQKHEPDRVIGRLKVRLKGQRVEWQGVILPFTITEFRIIKLLTDHPNVFVSYRAVYDVVHYPGFQAGDGHAGYRSNVRSLIKRIRNKFRKVDPAFDGIVNYTGMGYCWQSAEAEVPMIDVTGATVQFTSHPTLASSSDLELGSSSELENQLGSNLTQPDQVQP